MPIASPLTDEQWVDLATVLGIPLAAADGSTSISVINGWQNITSMNINGNNSNTQSAWAQMIARVQALPSGVIARLELYLTKWAAVAVTGFQASMVDGSIDSSMTGLNYNPREQLAFYADLIKQMVPIYQAGDNVGIAPPRSITFATVR